MRGRRASVFCCLIDNKLLSDMDSLEAFLTVTTRPGKEIIESYYCFIVSKR